MEYIQETLDRPSFNVDERAYTWATYAQEEITLFKNLQIQAGLRYVYHETAKSNVTPKLAVMYRLGDFTIRQDSVPQDLMSYTNTLILKEEPEQEH